MKTLMLIAGVLVTLIGLLWLGQGMGVVQWPSDSFMIGSMRWVYVGSVMAIMGIGLIAYALRRKD
jgi:uncharacterized membrane protein